MAVRDENVGPSVEVHIEKHRAPRPAAGRHPGILRHLGKRAVAAIEEQRVALVLKHQRHLSRFLGERRARGNLRLEPVPVVREHVRAEQVGESVAVDVRDVRSHGGVAHLPLRGPVGEPEVAVAVVHPEFVGVLEIVRHVELRSAVAVQVRELCAKRKRFRLAREQGASCVAKTR